MATWTKKRFGGHPVTESPPGENLELLQASLSGSVILALDVSGSMYGERLAEAKTGCARFIDEAVEDGYSVGMLLWDHDVVGRSPLERSPRSARELLDSAQVRGNNDIVPCLAEAHKMLMERPAGDRVLAIFGDGDLGPVDAAKRAASLLTVDGIRIITCGLGMASAEMLAVISDERDSKARVADSGGIADAIAGMTSGLIRRVR
ncbi:VWA domain-containing protein [Rhodococcus sp. GOMB7]|uniref:vWA domain-containing protein n=1 Tax=unclassified Rhodococcus (in: high G+C Gram-positive bacteria) TaxID=192944 RepID=UPI0004A9298E|nr:MULTISPECIES: vWA domain-containing protein [unclassified Rhodococcus (in: high G+C Gram-positive bacteria)]KDQ04745.1 hypothetical protein EN35_27805 [Rhodococcus qingshengii]MBT9293375.1 VWA domain-containing protein [Rhodococcus sp. GOMB7]MDV8014878.1 VWA domain-containing protein [Rhodococcus sp. IEGM 1241]